MNEKIKHQRHSLEGMGAHAQTPLCKDFEVPDISISRVLLKGTKKFDMGHQCSFRFTDKARTSSVKGLRA